MKHGFTQYSNELNTLRGVQGAVADLRHEAGQIYDGGTGWEGMDLDKPAIDMTLDELIEAFDYAIGCAESSALKAVRHYIDDMYRDDGFTVGSLVRKAKTVRAALRRMAKEAA